MANVLIYGYCDDTFSSYGVWLIVRLLSMLAEICGVYRYISLSSRLPWMPAVLCPNTLRSCCQPGSRGGSMSCPLSVSGQVRYGAATSRRSTVM